MIRTFFDLISSRGMLFVTYVSRQHEGLLHLDNIQTHAYRFSTTCAQLKPRETDCKVWR